MLYIFRTDMAEDQEKFCLKWNDFESNLSDAFRDLREEKDFLDVTLGTCAISIRCYKYVTSDLITDQL